MISPLNSLPNSIENFEKQNRRSLDSSPAQSARNSPGNFRKSISTSPLSVENALNVNSQTVVNEVVSVPSKQQIDEAQQAVNEVIEIMNSNIERVNSRSYAMSELEGRSESMQMGANQFSEYANAIHRKIAWENAKWKVFGVVLFFVLILIILQRKYRIFGGEI